nr:hypothetical protein [Tanacetum cinerariifolium]
MECKVDTLIKEAISLMGRSKSVFGMTSNTMYQLPLEPSRQEQFEDLVMNFILDQEERIKKLKNCMQDITDEFMEFSSEVTLRLKERIKENESKPQKIKKITRYPNTEDLKLLNDHKFSETLRKEVPSHTPKIASSKSLYVKHVRTVFPSPPLIRESTFGFKPDYRDPDRGRTLERNKTEEVGLNCNHNTPLSSREVPSFDGSEPQPLLNNPSLDVSLGDITGPEPPIKPHSLDSSRMKNVDDPKRHYGFKPGLLGKHVSLGVDISNWEMVDDDWGLESKEVSPLREELSLFDSLNEVERGRILEAHRLEFILQQ